MTWILLRNELRMLLRDTRTLLIAVVAPLVLFPLFIVVVERAENRESELLAEGSFRYAVLGPEADWAAERIRTANTEGADSAAAELELVSLDLPTSAADSLLRVDELHLLVVARRADGGDSLPAGLPVIQLRYRADSDRGRAARDQLGERLSELRTRERDQRYLEAGLAAPLDAFVPVESENIAGAGEEAGLLLGQLLVPFLLLLLLSGGSIVAADTLSGEKERGTLETLLTTAVDRTRIVRSKLLAILVVGAVVVMINILNLVLYLGIGVLELPPGLRIELTALQVGAMLLLFLPLAALVAAALLILSGIARSYREYQLYFFPLFLVFIVPSLAASLPGIRLESAIVLLPVSGIAVATKFLLTGNGSLLWSMIAFGSTAGLAALLLARTETVLSNERLISRGRDEADHHGGTALFPRRVIGWFTGFWVIFFLVSLWFGETLGLRGAVVVNLVGIFLGGATWLIHHYRLDPVEALSLRTPHWTAWPATLLGAPSLLVLGVGLADLVNRWILPVPDSLIEAFGEGLIGDLPVGQLVFFLALLPALLEELAFRGVLLHGLRRRLRSPLGAALACGAIFGLFHVSLFRIVPTAALGVALALVVLRTGSLYPAILWHLINNALAILPARLGWIEVTSAVGIPGRGYALAAVGAAISALLIARIPPPRPDPPGPRGGRVGSGRPPAGGTGPP